MKTWLRAAALILTMLLMTACAGNSSPTPAPSTETTLSLLDPAGNFVLFVRNMSWEVNPVDLKVSIDGQVLMDKDFEHGDGHNYDRLVLRLSPGTHTVVVLSEKGEAVLERPFQVVDKHTLFLDYAYQSEKQGTQRPKHIHFYLCDGFAKYM
jgi:hypothetical protein